MDTLGNYRCLLRLSRICPVASSTHSELSLSPKFCQSPSTSYGGWRGHYVVSLQCRTGDCTDALPRWACFQIGPSGLSFFVRAKLQILIGARLRAALPFRGAHQAKIRHFDVTRRERRSNHKTSITWRRPPVPHVGVVPAPSADTPPQSWSWEYCSFLAFFYT